MLKATPRAMKTGAFGDATVAATIGRLVQNAEVISLKGGRDRFTDFDLGGVPTGDTSDCQSNNGGQRSAASEGQDPSAVESHEARRFTPMTWTGHWCERGRYSQDWCIAELAAGGM